MPDASIVVTLQDRYSDTAKKMAAVTKAFTKDTEGLEQRLYALNKNKYTLKLDAQKAQRELKDAEKQFNLTQSAADGLKVELAQANYDNIVRNLRAVTKAAGDTEKAISKTVNKAESTGSGGGGTAGIVSAIAQTGVTLLDINSAGLRDILEQVKPAHLRFDLGGITWAELEARDLIWQWFEDHPTTWWAF